MSVEDFKVGDIVTGIYKTGKYIGEVTAVRPQHYLVKIKAVLKHPMQGDLHNPKEVDVPLFHERRSLALNEQTNIPKTMVRKFEGEVDSYEESLKAAINKMKEELTTLGTDWANRSLENITSLEKEYFK
ncbi:kinase-associated lipoprotein B [Litchfieldia alkalitelluris]|uniref:kinase-associated lipoprotein B n=1 Tax=Litchfieldia alkalitelluris TaxID=304268 RepID=UPI000998687C|nr:kinase-associated lipoprotein B [Litchfieldia alkalitelluris]